MRQKKEELLGVNMGVVTEIAKWIPNTKPLYIATNPPNELATHLKKLGFDARPLRRCTDNLRRKAGDATYINRAVMDVKGYTFWTPGFACAREVMDAN